MNSSTLYPLIRVSAAIAIMQIPCHAISVMDYMIIANGDPDDIDKALALSDSELGAIGVNNSTSLPSGNPSFPTGTRGPSSGIGLDGDVAITPAKRPFCRILTENPSFCTHPIPSAACVFVPFTGCTLHRHNRSWFNDRGLDRYRSCV